MKDSMLGRSLAIVVIMFVAPLTLSAQNFEGPQEDIDQILANSKAFSQAYMDLDYDALADAYTLDGKIFPGGSDIIEGRSDIRAEWVITNGSTIKLHELHTEEIKVLGDYAYDYGYYNGIGVSPDGTESAWGGKYVVVWQKSDGVWKMYIDIWNRRAPSE